MNSNKPAENQAGDTTSGARDVFQTCADLGYARRLVPIIPPDAEINPKSSLAKRKDARGKAVGVKGRDGTWHGLDWITYEADEDDLSRWQHMGAGLGVKTGDGLVAIDADTLDETLARIIRDEIRKRIPACPIRVGRFPKALYLVRVSQPYRYSRIEFGERSDTGSLKDRVEILSDGRQFVAYGIHPTTRKPYTWPRPLTPFDQLPIVDPQQLDDILLALKPLLPQAAEIKREGATAEVNQQALKGEPEAVRKAVAAIPNTSQHFPTRESYRDFGYAIKAALPDNQDLAFDIFSDWCARWTDGENDPGIVEADWRRMKPPFRRGAGWIYELAEQINPSQFSSAEVWFDNLENGNPFAEIDLNPFKDTAPAKKFVFEPFSTAAGAALTDPAKPLIKGLLDQGAMSIVYGDSNVGKTFVVMDMAYHVATGLPYAGMKTERGLVVYVAAEGGKAARKRLVALRDRYRPVDEPDFLLLPSPVDLRRPDVDLNAFKEALAGIGRPIALLVIDTVSRAMAGGDENSSVDMGALVKHFDLLRVWSGAHLLGVHHTGKDKAKGARGHSLLRAATDTEIEIEEGRVTVTKQRDLDKAWASEFALDKVVIGMDGDGLPVTSCVVRMAGAKADKGGRLTPGEARLLDGIRSLVEVTEEGERGIRMSDMVAWAKDNLSKSGRDGVKHGASNLLKKGYLRKIGRGIFELTEKEANFEWADDGRKSVEDLF